jgi:preprotein translocase subunit SecF
MRCEDITRATESILNDYRRLNIPLDEYLLIRERAIHEIMHGIEFTGGHQHLYDDALDTIDPTETKPVISKESVTNKEPVQKTNKPAPKTPARVKPAPRETNEKQDNMVEVMEVKTNEEMSDFEILKNLKDEWN